MYNNCCLWYETERDFKPLHYAMADSKYEGLGSISRPSRAPNRVSFDFGLILINNSQHRSLVMVSHLVLARQNGLWAHDHSFFSLPSLGTLRIRSLNIVRPFRLMPFVALMLMETLVWNSACAVHGHW